MKIALDPYMHRHLSLPDICRLTAELVFAWGERAEASSRFMRDEIQRYVDKYLK